MSDFAKEAEDVALEGLKAMKQFLIYQGKNSDWLQKAKIGAMAVGAYTRLRATMANEQALALMAKREQQKHLNP